MADKLSREQSYLAYLAGESSVYPTDPYTRTELYLYAMCKNGGGGVTPEEIEKAVEEYLEEHPVQSTPIDDTLTLKGYAADAKAAGDMLNDVKSSIPTKTSELENDSGYITDSALGDYATQEEFDEAQGRIEDAVFTAEDAVSLARSVQENAITAISVNGEDVPVENNKAEITVSGGSEPTYDADSETLIF